MADIFTVVIPTMFILRVLSVKFLHTNDYRNTECVENKVYVNYMMIQVYQLLS